MKLFAYTNQGNKNYLNLDQVVAYECDKYGSVKAHLPEGRYIWFMNDDAKRLLNEIEKARIVDPQNFASASVDKAPLPSQNDKSKKGGRK